MPEDQISVSEAARIAGVSPSTLQRWAQAGVIPVRGGRWTTAAAAQARVVGRMRERGHSLAELRRRGPRGPARVRLRRGPAPRAGSASSPPAEAAERTGLEEALDRADDVAAGDADRARGDAQRAGRRGAWSGSAACSSAGFPLVALLQLIRVYAQSIRKIAEAEVRLFHLYVHEPLIRQGVDALADGRGDGGAGRAICSRSTSPLMEYIHQRYLRFYIEQDVVGHMEAELGGATPARPGADGVLLRRPDRLHPLHRGGGRRGGARPRGAVRRDGRGDAAGRGD